MIDTLAKAFDSATTHENIVGIVNTTLEVIPPVNPFIDGLKYALIALGGFFTARGISFFKKRNEAKKKP